MQNLTKVFNTVKLKKDDTVKKFIEMVYFVKKIYRRDAVKVFARLGISKLTIQSCNFTIRQFCALLDFYLKEKNGWRINYANA